MITTDDMQPLEEGIAAAEVGDDSAEIIRRRAEQQQVSRWQSTLKTAREFDNDILRAYARDRRYARGDSGFEVDTNIIGSNLDTMVSFVYARDPDVDVIPSQMAEAPKEQPPQAPQPPDILQQAMQGVLQGGPEQAGFELARAQDEFQQAQMLFQQQMAEYQAKIQAKRQRKLELDLFSQTLEIVISKLWKKGKLKRQARRAVRSAMTVGVGYIKLSWQERAERDPLIQQQINDLQDSMARIARLMEEAQESQTQEIEAKRLQIEQHRSALEERAERVVARGLAIDFVRSENLAVAPGVEILQLADAPWVCEYLYMRLEDAAKRFPDVSLEKLRKATRYQQVKPKYEHDAPETTVTSDEASTYRLADSVNTTPSDTDYICIEEIWSLDDGIVYTTAEGLDFWLADPAPPNVKSPRFYPYFPLAFIEVDGERSPQSLVYRTWKLQNEYSRTRSAWAKLRRRSQQGVLFDSGEIEPASAKKLEKGQIQEFTGIKTVSGRPLKDVFIPKPLAIPNPALYDTVPILRDMDRSWGIQEALQGSIESAKTATEAEIQQTGFQSRTGSMRDLLEDWLSEMAVYTAQVATQMLTQEDVLALAGPDAVWPEISTADELEMLVDVDIRAGSTGKPNTRGEREAWATILPLVQNAIAQVGQLRGSSPSEIADKLEELVAETVMRSGDRIDVARLLPQSEGMNEAPQMGGQTVAPGMPPTMEPAGVPPTRIEQ